MAVVAVLGCGPAGLFAAQALALNGIEPVIFSKKQKSEIYGAQYLHRPIPELSPQAPAGVIHTIRVGTAAAYAERVYGLGTHPTSWDRVVPLAPAWDIRQTYDAAWEKFEARIVDVTLDAEQVDEFTAQFDLVISTVPKWAICKQPSRHFFNSVDTLVQKGIDLQYVADMAKGEGQEPGHDWVVYNGTHAYPWYRASNIFGHTSIEARSDYHLYTDKTWEPGFKVVGNDCTCHEAIVKTGRMGLWQAGVLSHHAFETTCESIADQFGANHPSTLN